LQVNAHLQRGLTNAPQEAGAHDYPDDLDSQFMPMEGAMMFTTGMIATCYYQLHFKVLTDTGSSNAKKLAAEGMAHIAEIVATLNRIATSAMAQASNIPEFVLGQAAKDRAADESLNQTLSALIKHVQRLRDESQTAEAAERLAKVAAAVRALNARLESSA
jgi:hypothetical protein